MAALLASRRSNNKNDVRPNPTSERAPCALPTLALTARAAQMRVALTRERLRDHWRRRYELRNSGEALVYWRAPA